MFTEEINLEEKRDAKAPVNLQEISSQKKPNYSVLYLEAKNTQPL